MNVDEERGGFQIDRRLDRYKSFFDHGWAAKTLRVAGGTVIGQAAFDLTASWKAIANTHRMPSVMMEFMDSFWQDFVSESSLPHKFVRAIRQLLWKNVPDLSESKRRLIRAELDRIADKVILTRSQKTAAFSSRNLWEAIITPPAGEGFALGIWGSQRLCYPALYHFYEDFLREVMVVKMANPDYRVRSYDQLAKDANKYLGAEITAYCLTNADVNLVRLVRNAFAHNGGRLTKQLRELQQRNPLPLAINGDTLQIMAGDTAKVFDLLKDRVYRLVEAAIN
jgi:hypothetical protein